MAEALLDLGKTTFDVAVIDLHAITELSRVDAVRLLRGAVSIIVLDDSDRWEYSDVDALLAGWDISRFVSLRPAPFQATETSIFVAPPGHRPPNP